MISYVVIYCFISYSKVRNIRGSGINGWGGWGSADFLKINKRGVCNKRGGGFSIQDNFIQDNSNQDHSTRDNSTQDNFTQDNFTQKNSSEDMRLCIVSEVELFQFSLRVFVFINF